MGPYTAPVTVVPRKSKPGALQVETKRLVVDYRVLDQQIPRVQTAQAKSKGSLTLIKTEIDHIWSELKGAKYFTILDMRSGYSHILIHPDSRPKTVFTCPYGKFQW